MDKHIDPAPPEISAAQAFEELRGEVGLLKRAIEGLAAERRDQPDYGPTLEALAASTEQLRAWAIKVNERPGIKLSPSDIGGQIEAAAAHFRQRDQEVLDLSNRSLANTFRQLESITRRTRDAYEQTRLLQITGCVSFLGGCALWAVCEQIAVTWR